MHQEKQMRHVKGRFFSAVFVLAVLTLAVTPSSGSVNVTTYHNDNPRTGQNIYETILTPANVNSFQFGKMFSLPVQGQIYGQPLYVSNLNISGGTHNVVFVATEEDWLYAFDADNLNGGIPLWSASLTDTAHGAATGEGPASSVDIGCPDITPSYGVTSTPVIDPNTNTMYVEAKSEITDSSNHHFYIHRIHALDITTGQEKQTPANIGGNSNNAPSVTFDPAIQQSRPGLLLLHGIIYAGFASHCDDGAYHGWVFAFDAKTLNQLGAYVTTPNGKEGGIWMSGAGLASDDTYVYAATGNGSFDSADSGDSILKLRLFAGSFNATYLGLADSFTPHNQDVLNNGDSVHDRDMDLGSGGVLLLPNPLPNELVQAGKEGTIYVVNRDKMGSYCGPSCTDHIVQEIPQALGVPVPGQLPFTTQYKDELFGMPAYWNNSVYFWGTGDTLKKFSLSNGQLSLPPAMSQDTYGKSATPSISSAPDNSNGIVWTLKTDNADSGAHAVLQAHDANSLGLLYSTDMDSGRDDPGAAVKFTVPTIANGKVYVGAVDQLSVYGLLSPPYAAQFYSQAAPATMIPGQSYSVSVTMQNTGSNTWTSSTAYRLGSQNPQDNTTWGLGRVQLPSDIPPQEYAVFNFSVTAPSIPGTYNFQWRMLQENVEWFGDYTQNMPITVCATPGAPTNVSGTANGGGQVSVTWNPPSNNGGCPITAYAVYVYGAASNSQEVATTATSTVVTGLTPNAYYTFAVTAWNGSWSPWSGWSPWVWVSAQAPAPPPVCTQPANPPLYSVQSSTCGTNEYTAPTINPVSSLLVDRLPNGHIISIVCQTTGDAMPGFWGWDALWDQLSSGLYVADTDIFTNSYQTVAPLCGNPPTAGGVVGPRSVSVYVGPTVNTPVMATLSPGQGVTILCQVHSGASYTGYYGTGDLWDQVTYLGGYVPDMAVDTGVYGQVAPTCPGFGP